MRCRIVTAIGTIIYSSQKINKTMIKVFAHPILFASFSMILLSWGSFENNEGVFRLMDRLAASKGLEAVHGDKFPEINPYGSYGSSYVLDFIDYGDIEDSILFLARKHNEIYNKDSDSEQVLGSFDHTLDMVHFYDYFLVFAVKENNTESFVVRDVLDDAALKGMSLYYDYGAIDMESIQFNNIEDGSTIDISALDRRKLSIPILISSISSTQILFYYEGKWIEHVEIDI